MPDDFGVAFWEEAFRDYPGDVNVVDFVLAKELLQLGLGNGRSALDMGCGSGTNTKTLADAGWEATGSDWATGAIAVARANVPNAEFVRVDSCSLDLGRTFDLVLCSYALPPPPARRGAMQAAARHVAPGGTLLVYEWHESMAAPWGFNQADLATPEGLMADLAGTGLHLDGEIQTHDRVFPAGDMRATADGRVQIALVRGHRP